MKKERSVPVVTLLVCLACVAVFAWTKWTEARLLPKLAQVVLQSAYVVAHDPTLEVSPEVRQSMLRFPPARRVLESARAPRPGDRQALQQELDRLAKLADALRRSDVRARLAFGGQSGDAPWRVLTSLFVHADWPHLLFNLCFLWLAGVALEARLGRLLFAGLYLALGALAAAVHHALSAHALIGASGAIAGMMGLVAVLLPRAKIGIIFRYFEAPAYLLVGLWGTAEWLAEAVAQQAGGVARYAHLGGFAGGLAAGAVLRLSGARGKPRGA